MSEFDKRIDAYIAKAQPFAQPILEHLRQLIHQCNPEVQETIKWGMPAFEYKGPYIGMAAFKNHVAFGFWKYTLIKDDKGYLSERSNKGGEAMGNLGKITSLKDLPPDKVIIGYIKQATKLNDEGIKVAAKPKQEVVVPELPAYFAKALKENKAAQKAFKAFSAGAQKEYILWLEEAKTEATRNKRMETALEWIAEGKRRNWKYETPKK